MLNTHQSSHALVFSHTHLNLGQSCPIPLHSRPIALLSCRHTHATISLGNGTRTHCVMLSDLIASGLTSVTKCGVWPGKSLKIDVEYLNFIVKKVSADDVLAKHMDHKNDQRHGYNYSAIYSYFVQNEEDLYRVKVVMSIPCKRWEFGRSYPSRSPRPSIRWRGK